MDETIWVSEAAKAMKKATLYQSWKQEVYNKISSQIDDAVSSLDPRDVKWHLQTQYEAFLCASNHKTASSGISSSRRTTIPSRIASAWSRSTCRASRIL